MVPGMLYSRFRPGLNHLAFRIEPDASLHKLATSATDHGWIRFESDRHAIAGGAEVAYLEDRDGFEVELVAPALD
jgi:catechol 2,3-dioxygenase-like lactoylglutathione lyase family enzyme